MVEELNSRDPSAAGTRRLAAGFCHRLQLHRLQGAQPFPQLPEHQKTLRLPLAEKRRQHLHQIIDGKKLDTTHVTDAKAGPIRLVCTKTQASYERVLLRPIASNPRSSGEGSSAPWSGTMELPNQRTSARLGGAKPRGRKNENDPMSEVRLVVREAGRDWSWTIHGRLGPTSRLQRRAPTRHAGGIGNRLRPLREAKSESPFFAIFRPDCAMNRMTPGSSSSTSSPVGASWIPRIRRPDRRGEVRYHDGQCATDNGCAITWPKIGCLTSDHCQWPAVAAQRRRERAARPPSGRPRVF